MESKPTEGFFHVDICSLLFYFLVLLPMYGVDQGNPIRAADMLSEYLNPIGSHEEGFDYTSVIAQIKHRKIIGLGESSHGTSEFFRAKANIILQLIQAGELKTVLIESEHAGLESINAWLQRSSKEDIEEIIRHSSLYGIYRTEEVLTMLRKIKQYNRSHDVSERVSFYGIDMQHTNYITNSLMNMLLPEGLLEPQQELHLKHLDSIFDASQVNKVKLSSDKKELSKRLISAIKALAELKNKKSMDFYATLLHQSLQIRAINPSSQKLSELRDKFMADNIIWLSENVANNEKVVIWGHNGHISKRDSRRPKRMGYYLREYYDNEYYALGFAFNQGGVNFFGKSIFYEPVENKKAIEFIFKNCEPENFFLQVDDFQKNPALMSKLSHHKFMRVLGATRMKKEFYHSPFWEAFDGILFFNTTHPAEIL